MLNGMKMILSLNQINNAIVGFQGFTYTLSGLSQIIIFESISEFGIISHGKSNLHAFDLRILYL